MLGKPAIREMELIVSKLISPPVTRFAAIAIVAIAASVALLLVSTAVNARTPAPSSGSGQGQGRGQGAAAPAAPAAPAAGRSTGGPAPAVRGAAPGHPPAQRAYSPNQSYSHRVQPPTYYRGARAGVFWSAPIIATPWWHYPDPFYAYGPAYYHPPVVRLYDEPMVYIEQPPSPAVAAPATNYWYYCEDSKTYFPYVQTCASPWVRVMPHAPPP